MKKQLKVFLILIILSHFSFGQNPSDFASSQIYQSLQKLNVLGKVLYIAAHPDDENTRLISYWSNEKLYQTAYLSLTRGDGGQNLIGPEIREQLGIIRTQELLEARKIDGGQQFFSRANDFGFSKNAEETFNVWNKEAVLADVVWVIRNFQPDVIVTRFSPEPMETHGHHTASAILAKEAFKAAADPNRFPEQLAYVKPWITKRILWNTNTWFYSNAEQFNEEDYLKVEIGGYSPLKGLSYTEIASLSRSMHKSQGFGASGYRGQHFEYLDHIDGEKAEHDIFEGVDTSWKRIEGGKKIASLVRKTIKEFQFSQPSQIVPRLIDIRKALNNLPDGKWKALKIKEVDQLIQSCLGLYLEGIAQKHQVVSGDNLEVTIEVVNRSNVPVRFEKLTFEGVAKDSVLNMPLKNNQAEFITTTIKVPQTKPITQPYWLAEEGSVGMFRVTDQKNIGKPQNEPPFMVNAFLNIQGENIVYDIPVVYKWTDPIDGEKWRPLEIIPPVFVNIADPVYVFGDSIPKTIHLMVKAGIDNIKGKLMVDLPEGWKVQPSSIPFTFDNEGEESRYTLTVIPPENKSSGYIRIYAQINGNAYSKSLVSINYPHIPAQTIFPETRSRLVKAEIKRKGENIGYIMGAGDDIPSSLAQIGYQVQLLGENEIRPEVLSQFDAIITGIRAYNTVERLRYVQKYLLSYVENGGTLIVQYNTNFRMVTEDIAPYPLQLSRKRIAVEEAPVTILKPDHPIMNHPNQITQEDFQGWVQERGLYFPEEWDERYEALISSHDPGEEPLTGGLLIAQYGKGYYIYTSYSWFRQLPAGVPGAYRVFTNMISVGK
jgi:LmbE family N-acetylglucosaminyl deacetylase